MTNAQDPNEHLHRRVHCMQCGWFGETGELIAGSKPGLRCPECDSPDQIRAAPEPQDRVH